MAQFMTAAPEAALPDWQQAIGDVALEWWVAARRLQCSEQLCALLGLPRMPADVLAELTRRIHPHDLPGLDAALATCWRAADGRLRHECRMQHGDGSERWVLIRGQLMERDGFGRGRGACWACSATSPRAKPMKPCCADTSISSPAAQTRCRLWMPSFALCWPMASRPAAFGLHPADVVGRERWRTCSARMFHEVMQPGLSKALAGEPQHFQRWMH